MKRHIACFALLVDDYDRAIAYYTDVMGFELREDSPREAGKRWVVVAPAGAETASVRSNVRAFRNEQFVIWRCTACKSIHAQDDVDLALVTIPVVGERGRLAAPRRLLRQLVDNVRLQ